MKIVSSGPAAPMSLEREVALQNLKKELAGLKEEVAFLRAATKPTREPSHEKAEAPIPVSSPEAAALQKTAPTMAALAMPPPAAASVPTPTPAPTPTRAEKRAPQDPLFAQLWAYVNNQK